MRDYAVPASGTGPTVTCSRARNRPACAESPESFRPRAVRHQLDCRQDPIGGEELTGTILTETILILAPHMDDETLACGGTMLLHVDKAQIHCLFATDGARSPEPPLPWMGGPDPRLPETRRREALEAAATIGVPSANLRFLELPDGRLARLENELAASIAKALGEIRPAVLVAPFRYDVHPDHTAL